MKDHYNESWQLYIHHTEGFNDDLDYYRNFCKGKKSLELFAGYGRLTNQLLRDGIDIETIELSPEFAKLIALPAEKNHIGDVTQVVLPQRFERIFAAYNSFCLLTEDSQLHAFFRNMSKMLAADGEISLSYYHPDFWSDAVSTNMSIDGRSVTYEPSFDLTRRNSKRAVWRDKYIFDEKILVHEYPVRIFETDEDLLPFLQAANLRIARKIRDFNNQIVSEPGWVDYLISF